MTMRYVCAFGIFFGMIATIITAMNHQLGWTVLGVICVGYNIRNFLSTIAENTEE